MPIYAKLQDVRNLQRQAQQIQETLNEIVKRQERIDKIIAEISEVIKQKEN